MTRDKLAEYCELREEIFDLEKRIHKIERDGLIEKDSVKGSSKYHPYTLHNMVVEGPGGGTIRLLEILRQKLSKQYERLLEQQIEIEDFIETIEKPKLREIFRLRYLDGYTWYQIALECGYNNEDTPRKKHDRFLEKNL